ncbi:cryptochrome/photolyase family protein [Planobispora takensis]|uniref:Deoxyribodipyrimidine photo-lyase n=1 Tax=Planobispora takensis TaxID=1367882 RepID=A0A8J3SX50_9ACTN|nr:deoxyribodipyrimidine photo-lyase [Planobispora takensis]GII01326.1 deoxyribodipyrimidine photo-lyase [Planobispora takensis]
MDTVIVLFNRDLRVHDHPALAAACAGARRVVPLFVVDPALTGSPRGGFLVECLADLRDSLRRRGGDLAVRRGDPVTETVRLARELSARAVYVSADVSAFARARERRLAEECARHRMEFRTFPGVTIVPPGALRPSGGGDHYRIFTPYLRSWSRTERRRVLPAPRWVPVPENLRSGWPEGTWRERARGEGHPLLTGGETVARKRMSQWLRWCVGDYAEGQDDLAGNRTSKLSPYLRFGCLSPLELESLAEDGGEFVRQLCWRDFHHQVTFAFPRINRDDYRSRGLRWHDDEHAAQAWKAGMTGVPIVDAGMRQLRAEGWMHNRARLITSSFLVKWLKVDWRVGAAHFWELLLDGDVANNYGNWQWVAGTGNDTRPNRVINPIRQAVRFDPDGEYVRRYLPELEAVPGRAVHRPWRLPSAVHGYPGPLVPLD